MKRAMLTVLVAMALLVGGYGVSWASYDAPARPHTDYRPGYGSSCSGSAACHDYAASAFLPAPLGKSIAADFTNFCLSCHNAVSEAHEKKAGSPSTNSYPNPVTPTTGDSHSWTGNNGNAGTSTPTIVKLEGTSHMPGGTLVTCQVCHQAMGKTSSAENIDWLEATTSDNINYTMQVYSGGTEQNLAQYIKVYRTATAMVTPPTNSRTRKDYLVDPAEYTYNYANGTVTFGSAQVATDHIYIDIPQPNFRAGNAGNALCLDCHGDRIDTAVSHAPGVGGNDHHPVTVAYGHSSGLNDTMKATADSNIYIEGGQVLCTSCHDPHNAASKDGQITRNADSSELCTDCHAVNGFDGYSTAAIGVHNGNKHSVATNCLDCHTTHDTTNIMLIKTNINGKTINFQNFTGVNSFGNDTGSSICEACHSTTSYHKADGTGTGHNTGKNCTECHKHETGFGGGGCSGCHAFPPDNVGPFLAGWADTTGDAHVSHIAHLNTAAFGFISTNNACKECHGATIPRGDHNTNKDTAGIDSTTWETWGAVGGNWGAVVFDGGTTIGKVNTSDDSCTNVSCHSNSGSRVWGGGGCDGCHSYPTSATNDWTAGNGHAARYDVTNAHMPTTGYDPANDDYVTMTTDLARCGKCHYSGGNLANHKNGTVNTVAQGFANCSGTDFTINVIAAGSNVTCSNVSCHVSTTPNWH